jgi:serine phosphatase RsbU (regulator of sigma subunit)/pSer/pThr/pTyr-binding forkhead associated (FHA) protein
MYLVPVAGPDLEPIALSPKPAGQTIGRHEQCDLHLPADAEKVSRFHARLIGDTRGQWRIVDTNSRWGTFLNGVKLTPDTPASMHEGDLVHIAPWTFSFSPVPKRRGLQTSDDAGQTTVRSIVAPPTGHVHEDILTLLMETASVIHEATNEKDLAERIMSAAIRGTGLQNALVLRPVDTGGKVEVVASQLASNLQGEITFSRSLIAAAAKGEVAEISQLGGGSISQSMVAMKISAALCVPIMLGPTPAQYLYLDSRGALSTSIRPQGSNFCVALGRMASLALSNLKRIEMERRSALIDYDLRAAAEAQKWILPKRNNAVGSFTCVGESRAGQYVGGDFFDIVDLGSGKVALAVGDVTGKGVAASVLMTATQGYLHACLLDHGDPERAVTALNRFISPRRDVSRFVTMWVGVIDRAAGTLTYIDAGHGYAVMIAGDATVTPLDKGRGLPIGVDDTHDYQAERVALPASGRVMVVSDGIIEQPGLVQRDGQMEEMQFDMAGVIDTLQSAGDDAVADLFAAVIQHAGTESLADDATAVLVRW